MNNTNIRPGKVLFSELKRFPYGFKKSGDFSIAEAEVLSIYGQTLHLLAMDTLEPESTEEAHFILVAKGLTPPDTTVERSWLKFIQLTSTKKNFFTLHSSNFNLAATNEDHNEFINGDLEFEA
ncbi:DUF413 domain-containing protein [uncultured Paraglaciecola sp.]|uniref:DUF413 domain-containing protein n=1 Tax=uncultured Paraglaciecola sp. TaxID=1765024 RepID=UPI002606A7DD|nr:DUF413 domain-containing protein [uncultured Paraglaciecola sp.]